MLHREVRRARRQRLPPALAGVAILGSIAIAALVEVSVVRVQLGCPSKLDRARMSVEKYANEAYPQWSIDHPSRACPRSIADLKAYVDLSPDPWGVPYLLTCTHDYVVVISAGEDREFGTDDDVRSDR